MVHPTRGPGVVTHVDLKAQRPITVRFDGGEVHQYSLASASQLKLESEVSAELATQERRATEHEELERELAAEWEGEADRLAATPVQCAWAQPPWQSQLVWESSDIESPAPKALSPVVAASGSPHTACCLVRDVPAEVEHWHFVDDESDKHRPINRKKVHPIAAAPSSLEVEADLFGIVPGSMTSPPF